MFFFVFGLMWLLTVTSYFTRSQLGSNLPTIAHFPSPFRSTRACVYHCYNYAGFFCFVFSLSSLFLPFWEQRMYFLCREIYTRLRQSILANQLLEFGCFQSFWDLLWNFVCGKRFNVGDEPINTYLLVEQVSSVGACVKWSLLWNNQNHY